MRALLYEVSATPKPGLVDREDTGSHKDMDFFSFLDSSAALAPWFYKMFCTGWEHGDAGFPELFLKLRRDGLEAEKDMLRATGNVNTHKGLIFSMGILCGGLGFLRPDRKNPVPGDRFRDACAKLGRCALDDFAGENVPDTNGLRCYREYKIAGARGEAAKGFPTAWETGLPALLRWAKRGLPVGDATAAALLEIMANIEDTNMIRRGGIGRAATCRKQAQELLEEMNTENFRDILRELNRQYVEENLSPGGSADVLALSLMLYFLTESGLISRS